MSSAVGAVRTISAAGSARVSATGAATATSAVSAALLAASSALRAASSAARRATIVVEGDRVAAVTAGPVEARPDDRVADLDKPVRIVSGGKELYAGTPPRTAAALAKTLAGRGDPRLMFAAEVTVEVP